MQLVRRSYVKKFYSSVKKLYGHAPNDTFVVSIHANAAGSGHRIRTDYYQSSSIICSGGQISFIRSRAVALPLSASVARRS